MDTGDLQTRKQCTEPGHTELVSAWCQTCQTFVCIQGIVSPKHAGHVFVSLEKIAEEHRASTHQKKKELSKIKENLEKVLLQQSEIETQFDEKVQDIDATIERRAEALQSDIESWKTKVKSALQKKVVENKELMKARQEKIKEDQNKLQETLDQCNVDHFEMVDNVIQAKHQTSVYNPASLVFREGNLATLDLDGLLGHISDEDFYGSDSMSTLNPDSFTSTNDIRHRRPPESEDSRSLTEDWTSKVTKPTERLYDYLELEDVEILEHGVFHDPDQKVDNTTQGAAIKLAASTEEGVWVTCTGKRCIKHFNDKGDSTKQIISDFDIADFGFNSKNELFATVHNGFKIKKKGFFKWKSLVRTEPYLTFGINLTPEDDILVCLQGIDCRAEIHRYSPAGDNKQRIYFDQDVQDGKEIFLRPRQVLEVGPTRDVLVIDSKRLITLDKDGKVTKTWRGELDMETGSEAAMNLFHPVSIAVASHGNSIVLDTGNKRIVVFDKHGQILWSFNDTVMLEDMNCVVFDNEDKLWVACTNGALHHAKLHFNCNGKTD
ncbi:uncharacterized protein LOC132562197 [Ylistrum balloti]|uniref:uncharacterized protein LOC132562197 n=1 Tax=Ylistrum balloti TaxID=509963 RepID=UPI002905DEDB|nr:uncharacterized protein LOC132562197 [Ylistrum balloti]